MDRISERLNLLEEHISLLNSKNEQKENDIRLMNEKIDRMNTLVDRKNSEWETQIMGNKFKLNSAYKLKLF